MGSLLNFIFEKTFAQHNGVEGNNHRGPIINEIILKHNHSRTEYWEFKEGYKNIIVFEFTSLHHLVENYQHKDKLLDIKKVETNRDIRNIENL